MNIVTDNRPKFTNFVLSTIIIFLVVLIVSPVSRADFDIIYFSVNGDTTATSMVQGDVFGWGSNCDLGASIQYEIFFDVNNNSIIDRETDILLNSEQFTDGSLLHEETTVPDGSIFVGTFILSLPPGTYLFRALDLATDSSIQNSISVSAMPSPPNQISGTVTLPGVSAPNSLLANIGITAESDSGDEGFFIAVTDNNGNYTLNISSDATGIELFVVPAPILDFVNPDYASVVASGAINNIDFAYLQPVDSIWGFVEDALDNPLIHESEVYAYSYLLDMEKSVSTINGRYVIYFTEAEKGEWFLEHGSRNAPFYTTEFSLSFSHDTLSSFRYDFTLLEADTAIYAIVTEEGALPVNNYRIDASSNSLQTWTESVTDTGSSNIVRIPVSSLDNSDWHVNFTTWDNDFPLPMGFWPQPEYYNNVSPGDTLSFNLVAGCCIGYTGNIDNGPDDGSLGSIDINDLVYLVDFMFRGGAIPVCMEEGDVNGGLDGIDINDLVSLVDYMFRAGPAPALCP